MLNEFNNLKPFLEENYQELGVREYARIVGISPPTASTKLKNYARQGLLKMRTERKYLLFRANRESRTFLELSRIYWREKMQDLTDELKEHFDYATIVLFGSLTKLEVTNKSDIDLYVDAKSKNIDLSKFEKKYGRPIQLQFKTKSRELLKNIEKGVEL